ncbi:hypothetical protein HYDPIDRAFT_107544 [Hydnomerulius pinastri MD-312]|nr:hypothetical protein HYDPIDRAFT_107544 [Hydnomerulius pinastri MD-312]
MPVNYQGTIFNLETKYDLVGWIFSVTGPTPANSTVTNYFYPLTALYCHFCTMIATGKAKIPQMVQITWFTQAGVGRVNLGCNLDKVNTKNAVRQRRAQRLVDENLADNIDQTYSDSALPNRAGHCAETFPILFIRSIAGGTPQVLQNARGVAAKPLLVLSAERPNKLALPNAEDRQQILQDPCDDFCKHSIPRAGMTLDNFLVNNLPA